MAIRLGTALLFGIVIAALYHYTRPPEGQGTSFPMTILLLCVLIAMVTQVIGDSVARAFSLVGTLSIVRFRTVVRDTQDTAYVILSVIVGMAVGAKNPWVAIIGIAVVALAELLFRLVRRTNAPAHPEYTLRLRLSPDHDPDTLLNAALGKDILTRELISIGTLDKQDGTEGIWRLQPRPGSDPAALIQRLTAISGVRSARLLRRGIDED